MQIYQKQNLRRDLKKKHYKYNIGKSFDELFREPLQEKFPNTMYDTSIGGVINDLQNRF